MIRVLVSNLVFPYAMFAAASLTGPDLFSLVWSFDTTWFLASRDKGERFESANTLDLKTHIKATNKQLYVHSTSSHPPATIKAIAKGDKR